jgi:hypothetical protein
VNQSCHHRHTTVAVILVEPCEAIQTTSRIDTCVVCVCVCVCVCGGGGGELYVAACRTVQPMADRKSPFQRRALPQVSLTTLSTKGGEEELKAYVHRTLDQQPRDVTSASCSVNAITTSSTTSTSQVAGIASTIPLVSRVPRNSFQSVSACRLAQSYRANHKQAIVAQSCVF